MLVTWRRWLEASATILLVGSSVACSSSSGSSTEASPTLITVAPSTFGAGVVCGDFPGAWKTYVATLTDVTDAANPFDLPSSNPIRCTMPVSFAWVIPDHEYIARIQGYDRDDLDPYGGMSSGSSHLIDRTTKKVVTPRWTTMCGEGVTADEDAGVADAEAGATSAGGPTAAFLQTNVLMQGCDPLSEKHSSDVETGIVVDLAAVQDNLECSDQPGEIDHLKVIPEDATLASEDAGCGDKPEFSPLEADRTYRFRVEAFEAGGVTPRWAASCEGRTKFGVVLPAVCDTLSERGSLRIDIDALLSAAGHTCTAEDVVSYQAVLLGESLSATPASCTTDAWFNGLGPAAYQAAVEGKNAEGEVVVSAFCDGAIQSAGTTTMTCRVSSSI